MPAALQGKCDDFTDGETEAQRGEESCPNQTDRKPNLFSLSPGASLSDHSIAETQSGCGSPLGGRNLRSNRCFYTNQLPEVHINAASLIPDPAVPRLQSQGSSPGNILLASPWWNQFKQSWGEN